jgi:ribosomal-protein-alanine N-acetyltransferase
MERPFLKGQKVYLRALQESDADGNYLGWFNDAEVCAENSHHRFPMTRESLLHYVRAIDSSPDDFVMAIVATEADVHIGNIALQSIDRLNRSAEYAIVLGEKDYWRGGYGREASDLLIRHGFDQLNLQRIYLGTPENNAGMRRLAESLGMREEGRQRRAFFKNGAYEDIILYGLLSEEFTPAT